MKSTLYRGLRAAGGLRAVAASRWRRDRLLVLCYHGVSLQDEHEWNPGLFVPPALLRRRFEQLRDGGYRVLALDEALRRLRDGTLPPRSVALTFDDGTADFAAHAVPLLEEFGFPATLYLTTYYCFRRLPVFDTALRYVVWKGRDGGGDLATLLPGEGALPVADATGRARGVAAAERLARAQGLDAQRKHELLGRVAACLGVDLDAVVRSGVHQILAPDAVRALPRDLVDVQLHTHRHRTPRDHALFAREIEDNAAAIRSLVGDDRPLTHFCYPSGEYFGEFLDWLPPLGVRYATTCVPDVCTRDAHPLLLPRFVDTTLQSEASFEAWVSGAAALLPRRRAYRLDPSRLASRAGASAASPAAAVAG